MAARYFYILSQNCEMRLLGSSYLSVRPSARNNSAATGRIFTKFDIWLSIKNIQVSLKSDKK
jgi:hypothetical protein